MGKVTIDEETLDGIGQAIISKGGAAAPMTPAQMPVAIAAIPSGGDENAIAMVERTITSYSSDDVTFIGRGAFYMCESLVSVSLPNATKADVYGTQFQGCRNLVNINLPKLTNLASSMFNVIAAEEVNLPSVVYGTSGLNQCFLNAANLKVVRTPKLLLRHETTFFNGNSKLTDWYCNEIPCASIMAAPAFPHMANMTAAFPNITIHGSDGIIKYIDGAWTKVEV